MIINNIGNVLVVDDEVELKNILVEALTSHGYAVSGFTSGQEALEALRGEAFDLLLTDLMMPKMDGITLVRESLKIDPHLVCMTMTGQGTIQTAVESMKGGAFDYVLKPFRLQFVLPALTRGMNARRMRLENLQLRETVAIYALARTTAFTLEAGSVAHELNNLLTAINRYSSLALQRLEESHPIRNYLNEIGKAGDRAANLTRQLLTIGRKQILKPPQQTESVVESAPSRVVETILLVEDDDVVRRLVCQILQEVGYNVIETARGEEAVRLCSESQQTIGLLLTDVVMPGTSGKEVADHLTELLPELKVLFMSGHTDEVILRHGVLDSDVEFIQKPFTPEALSKKVREVLDKTH